MKLAIADPPYLGRGRMLYGGGRPASFMPKRRGETANTTNHPQAHDWDQPETHQHLCTQLTNNYDGWAIAGAPDTLRHYLTWVPNDTRICVWNRPNAFPTAGRVIPTWEFVLLHIPPARRTKSVPGFPIRDVLTANKVTTNVIGSKPPAWTRWILDMLGYDQDTDTIDDLFAGSGAVTSEVQQLTLI